MIHINIQYQCSVKSGGCNVGKTKLVLVLTFALVEAAGAVVGVGHHDHPVSWRRRDLFTPGGDTPRARAPGPVIAPHGLTVTHGLVVRGAVDVDAQAVGDLVPHLVVLHQSVLNVRHNAGRQTGGRWVAPLPLSRAGRPGGKQFYFSPSVCVLSCFVFCV